MAGAALLLWGLLYHLTARFLATQPMLGQAVAYAVVVLAVAALLLSGGAVFAPSPVPLLVALPCFLLSAFFVLFLAVAILISGVSYMVE